MTVDALGSQVWPNVKVIGGQRLLEYEDHFIFYLKNEKYHSAGYPGKKKPESGYTEWEEQCVSGEASSEGISLNTKLYKKACLSQKDGSKEFIVYDSSEDCFYKLVNHSLMIDWVYQTKRKGKTLMVTPLEAYREMRDTSNIDSGLTEEQPSKF